MHAEPSAGSRAASARESDDFAKELRQFHAYYLATRPEAPELDPVRVRQVCAASLLDRERQRNEIPRAFRDTFGPPL